MKKKISGGFVLEKEGNNIKNIISSWGRRVGVGQRVISNGRIYPYGRVGTVQRIHQPYSDGYTSDVIEVLFDGEDVPIEMKFKDLI